MKQPVALKIPSQHLLLTLDGLLIQLIHLACQKKNGAGIDGTKCPIFGAIFKGISPHMAFFLVQYFQFRVLKFSLVDFDISTFRGWYAHVGARYSTMIWTVHCLYFGPSFWNWLHEVYLAQNHVKTQNHVGVVPNYGTRKLPLRRAFANLSRPFAPQIGTWDYDQVFVYRFINSGIQTFREPYAALSRPFATAAKHTHPYLQMSLG